MTTLQGAFARLRRRFAAAGLPEADLDARILVLAAASASAVELAFRPERALSPAEAVRLGDYAARRLAREPVARILGAWEFHGLSFLLAPETLVPRPDSETVVAAALGRMSPGERLRVADLGTGSGCLLVALLAERPRAEGVGVDRSLGALRTARLNADRNGVGERACFACSDWGAALLGPFDLVVANPPYVASAVLSTLDLEVREHDPVAALDGGPDGLHAYRAIFADAHRLLAPQGHLVVEIGFDQAVAVPALAAAHSLDTVGLDADVSGRPRGVVLRRR